MYALSWIPMGAAFAFVLHSQPTCSGWCGVEEASYAMPVAALLGVGVWRITDRLSWPMEWRWSFLVLQVLLSLLYAGLWIVLTDVRPTLAGGSLGLDIHSGPMIYTAWRLLAGVWLYGILAGGSYAIRVNRRLREQGILAAEAEAKAAQARLQALRAQVNPHFLFNTLHTITALVKYDPPRAETALEELGDLLRYALSLESGDHGGVVPFAEEWTFTRTYLSIEELRLGDRLKLETSIAPEALSCPVPPLILQPLVENSIRHAISRTAARGTLSVSAERTGEGLVIRVEDDGPGADPEEVFQSRRLGLRSVRERLATVYAGRASMRVETTPGEGFGVTLAIPIETGGVGTESSTRGMVDT